MKWCVCARGSECVLRNANNREGISHVKKLFWLNATIKNKINALNAFKYIYKKAPNKDDDGDDEEKEE